MTDDNLLHEFFCTYIFVLVRTQEGIRKHGGQHNLRDVIIYCNGSHFTLLRPFPVNQESSFSVRTYWLFFVHTVSFFCVFFLYPSQCLWLARSWKTWSMQSCDASYTQIFVRILISKSRTIWIFSAHNRLLSSFWLIWHKTNAAYFSLSFVSLTNIIISTQ